MALVAYDNSDSSEFEDEEADNASAVTIVPKQEVQSRPAPEPINTDDDQTKETPTLFNQLPRPSVKKIQIKEEDDEFLHKKAPVDAVKPKAKITVPSLSDFKDVDSPTVHKPKLANGKKSGLLSMLPQPKNGFTLSKTSKPLIPQVLTQKSNTDVKKKLQSPIKKPKGESKALVNEYSDDSETEDIQNDFFSFNKPIDPIPEDIPLDMDVKTPIKAERPKLESFFKKDPEEPIQSNEIEEYAEYACEAGSSNGHEDQPTSSSSEAILDEEAILKLCGARGKRKREDIQIVDVNQDEVLGDAREWLLKGLMDDTSKRVSSSKRRGNEPTSQQKRKHQITYLAHQAKANEVELQNQWANSRMSRRQTQNKYGF